MSELTYRLLTKEEQDSSSKIDRKQNISNNNPIKKVINRFTLPDPTDAIGRKKELLEKIQLLIYLSFGIAVIIAVFVSNWRSFPQITNSVTNVTSPENFTLPVLGFCFPTNTFQGWLPWVWRIAARTNFHDNLYANCTYWRPYSPLFRGQVAYNQTFSCSGLSIDEEEACKTVVTINTTQQCIAFGNEECPIWRALKELNIVEVQLFAFWDSINNFPTTTPGGWYENSTIFFANRSSYLTPVLLGGISQAILEFHQENHEIPDTSTGQLPWKHKVQSEYPTSVTTLNILDNHLRCSSHQSEPRTLVDINEMCSYVGFDGFTGEPVYALLNPFSILELQIRLADTLIPTTSEELVWQFIYRSLKDIGGILGVVFTVISILMSKILTRLLFSKRDAFFDAQTRLAVTHFMNKQKMEEDERLLKLI